MGHGETDRVRGVLSRGLGFGMVLVVVVVVVALDVLRRAKFQSVCLCHVLGSKWSERHSGVVGQLPRVEVGMVGERVMPP